MARPILLAVDDDANVLEAVVQDLRRQYGSTYRVMRAAGGQAALDTLTQLKTREEPVALLLSDQRMPGMTGVEMLERSRDLYPEARRVLLTAYADTEAAIRAINSARIHYYLNKPWDPPGGEALSRARRPARGLAGRLPAALRGVARHRAPLVAQ